jgi:rod shape-determining protein MreD
MDERFPGIRPHPSLGRRLDRWARFAVPGGSTALLLLIVAGPLDLPAQAELKSGLALGCVFFWSLYRPASLPPLAVFLLGLLADLLGYGAPGLVVLVLLLTQGFVLRWRRGLVRQGFLMVWLAFVVFAIAAAMLEWLLTALLALRLPPLGPMVFEAAFAAGLYPLLALVLIRAHLTIADPAHA